MVNSPDNRPRRDPLDTVASLVFFAALLWVAIDIARAGWEQRALTGELNQAIAASNAGSPIATGAGFHQEREQWQRRRSTTAGFWIEKVLPFDLRMNQSLAKLHNSVGTTFRDDQVPAMAERHYILALLYDPSAVDVAAKLAAVCVYTGNYELGWSAIRLLEEDPESSAPRQLRRFFSARYSGAETDAAGAGR